MKGGTNNYTGSTLPLPSVADRQFETSVSTASSANNPAATDDGHGLAQARGEH
jgi:hypothetical protein